MVLISGIPREDVGKLLRRLQDRGKARFPAWKLGGGAINNTTLKEFEELPAREPFIVFQVCTRDCNYDGFTHPRTSLGRLQQSAVMEPVVWFVWLPNRSFGTVVAVVDTQTPMMKQAFADYAHESVVFFDATFDVSYAQAMVLITVMVIGPHRGDPANCQRRGIPALHAYVCRETQAAYQVRQRRPPFPTPSLSTHRLSLPHTRFITFELLRVT